MATKNASAQFVQHLQSLGFETVDGYLEWCRTHGFEAKTQKSRVQVSCEVAQVKEQKLLAILAEKRPVGQVKDRKKPRQDWFDRLRPFIDGTLTLRQVHQQPADPHVDR